MNSTFKSFVAVLLTAAVLAVPGPSHAAAPPGASLVDIGWSGQQGLAVLSKYELFRSRDGREWTSAGFYDRAVELTAVGVGRDLVLVATGPGALFRSAGGAAFQEVKAPRDPYGREVTGIRIIAVHPEDKEILASSGQGVLRSRDGGQSFEPIREPFWANPEAREVIAIGYVKGDPVVVTRKGAYRQDREGFEPMTGGLPDQVRPTVASVFDGEALMALPGEGLYLATRDSKWGKLRGAPGDPIAFVGFSGQGYLAARPTTALHVSRDKGGSWTPVGQYSPSFIPVASATTPFGDFIVLRGKGLVKLEGDRFIPVPMPLDLSAVNAMIVVKGNQLAGTQGGVYLSSSAGKAWEDVTPEELGAAVNVFLALPDGRVLLGSDGAGVFVSGDDGRTWSNWSLRLGTSNTIKGLVRYRDGVLAGTENGLMWTEAMQEPNWQSLDGGIGRNSVIALVRAGDHIWVGTQGGVYRAGDGEDFKPVAGIKGRVSSLAAEDGTVAALVNCQVVTIGNDLKIKELSAFDRCIASTVGIHRGTIYAGTNDGLYRWDQGAWTRAGAGRHPVARMGADPQGLRVVTRGAGTYTVK